MVLSTVSTFARAGLVGGMITVSALDVLVGLRVIRNSRRPIM